MTRHIVMIEPFTAPRELGRIPMFEHTTRYIINTVKDKKLERLGSWTGRDGRETAIAWDAEARRHGEVTRLQVEKWLNGRWVLCDVNSF